jgi:hypothetical protein
MTTAALFAARHGGSRDGCRATPMVIVAPDHLAAT